MVTEILIEKRMLENQGKHPEYLVVTQQTHIELAAVLRQEFHVPRHIHDNRVKQFNDLTLVVVPNLPCTPFLLGWVAE